ncbi:hypothetical protein EAF04_007848 [Stromatinia cepivora]|nr:hypothetical protein EAF04_007848 [Stromatinia cepivora]
MTWKIYSHVSSMVGFLVGVLSADEMVEGMKRDVSFHPFIPANLTFQFTSPSILNIFTCHITSPSSLFSSRVNNNSESGTHRRHPDTQDQRAAAPNPNAKNSLQQRHLSDRPPFSSN